MFEILGHTSEMIGTILIAFAALRVHGRELKEGKIDASVRSAIKRERAVGIGGVLLIFFGYGLVLFGRIF